MTPVFHSVPVFIFAMRALASSAGRISLVHHLTIVFSAGSADDSSTDGPPGRRLAGRIGHALLAMVSSEVPMEELTHSAIVFSPHPDDESLGCGGTIIKKKMAGASVKLVHMTDGSASHCHIISKEELRTIRLDESISAGRALGLSASDIYFLGFADAHLREHVKAAIDRLEEVLLTERPEEVFVPYSREPFALAADHIATTEIIRNALARCKSNVTIWEYPVWFWLHWPWVSLWRNDPMVAQTWAASRNSLRSFFGFRALMDLRHSVHIGDVLEQKRAALSQHRSQMERISPDPRWTTLGDVAAGEFIDNFYRDREFFYRYEYRP
jgi:LmbE family N-acetylglucosaminyl deacetylase